MVDEKPKTDEKLEDLLKFHMKRKSLRLVDWRYIMWRGDEVNEIIKQARAEGIKQGREEREKEFQFMIDKIHEEFGNNTNDAGEFISEKYGSTEDFIVCNLIKLSEASKDFTKNNNKEKDRRIAELEDQVTGFREVITAAYAKNLELEAKVKELKVIVSTQYCLEGSLDQETYICDGTPIICTKHYDEMKQEIKTLKEENEQLKKWLNSALARIDNDGAYYELQAEIDKYKKEQLADGEE